jgi:hypothetical protein
MYWCFVNRCSRIIWLGDLNYRVAASDLDTWKAVNQGDWHGLFQKDQVCELSEMMLFSCCMLLDAFNCHVSDPGLLKLSLVEFLTAET